MRLKPTYRMPFKRRRIGKTDYRMRLKLLTSRKPRLVVRKSLKHISAQIVDFDKVGDKTMLSVKSDALKKLGWNFACDNTPAAYLTGLLIGKNAAKKGIKEAVLDMGLNVSTVGSKLYAVAKGAVDGGLNVNIGEGVVPSEERIKGTHIATYLEKFKSMPEEFEKVKQKILGG